MMHFTLCRQIKTGISTRRNMQAGFVEVLIAAGMSREVK